MQLEKIIRKITPLSAVALVGVLLLVLIFAIEKPELVPPKAAKVNAEDGSGAQFLPADPEKKIAVVANRRGITPDFWPEAVKQLLRDDPCAQTLVLEYPFYSTDWEALQDLSTYDDNPNTAWGFARELSQQERESRMELVETAISWLDTQEADGSYQQVLELYNSHSPLARDYPVKPEDNWCATFASAVAIQCQRTDRIPTECSCDRQISLFQEKDCWEEADDYVPLPGDYIYYHWSCDTEGDCTSLADHMGIVVGTAGPFIKVIEGDKEGVVAYRVILVGAQCIRGYGVPHY